MPESPLPSLPFAVAVENKGVALFSVSKPDIGRSVFNNLRRFNAPQRQYHDTNLTTPSCAPSLRRNHHRSPASDLF